jgi:hypothetical protein
VETAEPLAVAYVAILISLCFHNSFKLLSIKSDNFEKLFHNKFRRDIMSLYTKHFGFEKWFPIVSITGLDLSDTVP